MELLLSTHYKEELDSPVREFYMHTLYQSHRLKDVLNTSTHVARWSTPVTSTHVARWSTPVVKLQVAKNFSKMFVVLTYCFILYCCFYF